MIAKPRTISHERVGRMLAGTSVLVCVTLGWILSPWFLLGAAGTALSLVLEAVTGRCAVKSLLIRLGLPGERELGRAEAAAELTASASRDAASSETSRPRSRRFAERLGVNVN